MAEERSPVEELNIRADKVWEKVGSREPLSEDELRAIVESERAKRQAWVDGEEAKTTKREEKRAEKKEAK